MKVNHLKTKVIWVQPYNPSTSINLITTNKQILKKKMSSSYYTLYLLLITIIVYWLLS